MVDVNIERNAPNGLEISKIKSRKSLDLDKKQKKICIHDQELQTVSEVKTEMDGVFVDEGFLNGRTDSSECCLP